MNSTYGLWIHYLLQWCYSKTAKLKSISSLLIIICFVSDETAKFRSCQYFPPIIYFRYFLADPGSKPHQSMGPIFSRELCQACSGHSGCEQPLCWALGLWSGGKCSSGWLSPSVPVVILSFRIGYVVQSLTSSLDTFSSVTITDGTDFTLPEMLLPVFDHLSLLTQSERKGTSDSKC